MFVWRRLSRVGEGASDPNGRSPTFIPGLEEETIRKVAVTPENLAVLLEVSVCGWASVGRRCVCVVVQGEGEVGDDLTCGNG